MFYEDLVDKLVPAFSASRKDLINSLFDVMLSKETGNKLTFFRV